MIQWHIEIRNLKDLKPLPKNPRKLTKHEEQQLTESINKFGVADKLIVNTDNTIIGGHQRFRILKKIGYKEVECLIPDRTLTEKEVEEMCIRLNRNSGEFDFDILANEFEIEELLDWGFEEKDFVGSLKPEVLKKEDKPEKEKKCQMCPSCGYEF